MIMVITLFHLVVSLLFEYIIVVVGFCCYYKTATILRAASAVPIGLLNRSHADCCRVRAIFLIGKCQ